MFTGVFVDGFEGQTFAEGARTAAESHQLSQNTWLSIDEQTVFTAKLPSRGRGDAHLVTFCGRAAKDIRRSPPRAYGHLGMFPGLVLVDEFLEIVPLEAGKQ